MTEKLCLTQYVQDVFVYNSLINSEFLRFVRPVVSIDIWDSKPVRTLVEMCYNFFDSYKRAPHQAIVDLMIDQKRVLRESEYNLLKIYLKELSKKVFNDTDKVYVLKRLEKELMDMRLCENAPKARELILQGEAEEGRQLILSSFFPVLPSEVGGVDYLRDFSVALNRSFENDFLMPTGVEELDKLIGGFRRQNLVCLFSGYKYGKTWYLQHIAKTAVMFGLNVYHASFEVPREEMEIRYDMMFGRLVNRAVPTNVEVVVRGEGDAPVFQWQEFQTVYNPSVVVGVREAIQAFGGSLIIEKFPPGRAGASMLDIENRIIMYEQVHGMRFHVVILDYIDLMKPLGRFDELRHQLNSSYIHAKSIADIYDTCVFTVSQINRTSLNRESINIDSLAEDIRKAGNVDLAIALCRTQEQKAQHFARLFVAAGRSVRDGVGCGIYQNIEIGEFCSWSVPTTFFREMKDEVN